MDHIFAVSVKTHGLLGSVGSIFTKSILKYICDGTMAYTYINSSIYSKPYSKISNRGTYESTVKSLSVFAMNRRDISRQIATTILYAIFIRLLIFGTGFSMLYMNISNGNTIMAMVSVAIILANGALKKSVFDTYVMTKMLQETMPHVKQLEYKPRDQVVTQMEHTAMMSHRYIELVKFANQKEDFLTSKEETRITERRSGGRSRF